MERWLVRYSYEPGEVRVPYRNGHNAAKRLIALTRKLHRAEKVRHRAMERRHLRRDFRKLGVAAADLFTGRSRGLVLWVNPDMAGDWRGIDKLWQKGAAGSP